MRSQSCVNAASCHCRAFRVRCFRSFARGSVMGSPSLGQALNYDDERST